MKHSIFINQNQVVEVHIVGDVSVDDVSTLGQKLITNITELERKGYRIDMLIDYSQGTNTEDLALALAKVITKGLVFHRIAGFAANETTTKVVAEVTKATNLEHKIRLFQTREEAEAWLGEKGN